MSFQRAAQYSEAEERSQDTVGNARVDNHAEECETILLQEHLQKD